MKTWKIISQEAEYLEAMKKVVNSTAKPGTNEFEEREFLLALIRDYEDRASFTQVWND